MRLVIQFVACLAGLAVLAPTARAQDATASVAARALFNEGVQLAEADQWEAAADRFHRALALRDSAVIAYNLGTTLTHLGHPVEAAECFRRVSRDASADPALRENATQELAAAEPTIAWMTIVGASDGLHLAIDGRAVHAALLGSAVPVDPGAHAITLVDGDGVAVVTQSVSLEPGERREVSLDVPEPEPEAEPEPAPPPLTLPAPEPPPQDDTWLWVGVGSGAGLLVIGGIILTIVLVSTPGPTPWSGNAGIVEARP
jgi:hypothetical protein